ncbi:MAG: sugar ABC transporter ATP-binding protein [Planctomycetota bacterium]|jgi:ABC-type sugar transport system ATPase subunit|nr:sugar ABC transporter ATP-binding protein [Planctomycetota bacterium]
MHLEATGIRKSFGGTIALDDVHIDLRPGEIHALVGENGAGKSTFLKILAGAERPDAGRMLLGGRPYAPAGAKDAERRGVAMVFQELTINPSLTIAENVFIDRMRSFSRLGIISQKAMRRAAQEILDSFSAGISVEQNLASLDLGKWKCVEIARALSLSPSVLFLDESTAFLNHREVDVVLESMLNLKKSGLGIAFVSHHLDEVMSVADTLTILKDGKWIGVFRKADIGQADIHSRMVGRDLSGGIFPPKAPMPADGDPVFSMSGVSFVPRLKLDELSLHPGEIVGIAGLKGAGGVEILSIAAGAIKPNSGVMRLDGLPYRPRSPRTAWKAGIAYLPGDRTGEGLLVDFPLFDNLVMANPPRRGPLFDKRAAVRMANELVDRLRIKTQSLWARSGSLSGGNMQKAVIAKCLGITPRILLLDNPTRGVDIGARHEIYRIIRDLAGAGMAILMASEDMPELIGMSDRLIVLRGGAVTRSFPAGSDMSENEIIRHMT